jgi:hypothetical protein
VHVRVGPRAQHQRLTTAIALVCSLAAGCTGRACGYGFDLHWERDTTDGVRVSWTLDPSPPVVGTPIVARLTLRDAAQKPLIGAHLRLEGLMSHPGMAPVAATLTERGNGEYDAPLQFTMAGDWILLVDGTLADGTPFTQRIEIAGVRPSP